MSLRLCTEHAGSALSGFLFFFFYYGQAMRNTPSLGNDFN